MVMWLILNGKKAGIEEIRESVTRLRKAGYTLNVRVTWEAGDSARFVHEAVGSGSSRVIAAGGDGTVNEVADAVVRLPEERRPEMGILPLGTANDFATACQIPVSIYDALALAVQGSSEPVDMGQVNERYFINIATGGFGAQVTAQTPVELKNFMGGGAYTLTGLVKALHFTPVAGVLRTAEWEMDTRVLVAAICNGRQAGGGQKLAPEAFINDGLLDITLVTDFFAKDIDIVVSELLTPDAGGTFVKRFRTKWLEAIPAAGAEQVNLDGEPYFAPRFRFEALPGALRLVLPQQCPCLKKQ